MSRRYGQIAALVLCVALPRAVQAHAFLLKSDPAVGATVSPAPAQMTMQYSEGVEPLFTTVEVHDASGVRVDAGTVKTAPNDPKTLLVALKPLKPGDYSVEWHATSVDTHKTQGKFSFTVAP